jgi:hypothetical protein
VARRDAVEAALREAGPVGEGAPEDAVLTGWVVVCEWTHAGAETPGSRWVDHDAPEGQGVALSVGLCRLGEQLATGG